MAQKLIRMEDGLAVDLKRLAADVGVSENQILTNALKLYLDYHYMESKACFIPREIINVLQSSYKMAENTINNKTNRVLSEVAIQLFIQNQIIAKGLSFSQQDINAYRLRALEFLKENQRVFRMDEAEG